MKADPYLTQMSIPEGMHKNMQEENDKNFHKILLENDFKIFE